MRDTAIQRESTMIPIGALQQAPEPHVSHAKSGAFIGTAHRLRRDEENTVCDGIICPRPRHGWTAVHVGKAHPGKVRARF
jgi:hypothetical protein